MADLGASNWSEVDASNNAVPPDGWPEGMAPSDVNNSARAQMGGEKRWWDRSNATQTTTGTSTAYVLTYAATEAALYDGEETSFVLHATCGATPTLNRDGLGAKFLRKFDFATNTFVSIAASDLRINQVLRVRYNLSADRYDVIGISLGTAVFGVLATNNTWTGTNAFANTVTMSGAAFNNAVRVDVASATTTDIGAAASNYVRVTGTTTITGLGTIASGVEREVLFAGILTLTHNATSLILPSGANITTAAGDTARFISEGSGNWRCVDYERASGAALSAALTSLTNSVAVDVPMNNTALFFTGPTVAQGTSGTWLAVGNITISGCTASATMNIKLWDGTTVIDSAQFLAAPAGTAQTTVHMSGRIVSPAGNIRISVQDTFGTTGSIVADISGAGKDSTLTVVRIA